MRLSTRHLIGSIVLAVIGGGESWGQTPTVSIETEYLATVEVPLKALQSVDYVPETGTVRGPKINGTIIPPSGDWLVLMPDGSMRLDFRATINTDDGEIILVNYGGLINRSQEVIDRFNNGEVITSMDAYSVVAPQFTTGSKNMTGLIRSRRSARWFRSSEGSRLNTTGSLSADDISDGAHWPHCSPMDRANG